MATLTESEWNEIRNRWSTQDLIAMIEILKRDGEIRVVPDAEGIEIAKAVATPGKEDA